MSAYSQLREIWHICGRCYPIDSCQKYGIFVATVSIATACPKYASRGIAINCYNPSRVVGLILLSCVQSDVAERVVRVDADGLLSITALELALYFGLEPDTISVSYLCTDFRITTDGDVFMPVHMLDPGGRPECEVGPFLSCVLCVCRAVCVQTSNVYASFQVSGEWHDLDPTRDHSSDEGRKRCPVSGSSSDDAALSDNIGTAADVPQAHVYEDPAMERRYRYDHPYQHTHERTLPTTLTAPRSVHTFTPTVFWHSMRCRGSGTWRRGADR